MTTTTKQKTPAAASEELTLIRVNPAELGVRDQAREDATPDEGLIASIRQHGIIQPPVVEQDPETGQYMIVAGHRRVGASIIAGLPEISCILRPAPLDAAVTLEQQIVENERRQQLTANDLAKGYEKLTLFGLRPEDIAAGLGETTERVRAGLRVTQSKTVSELVTTAPSIDFQRAAIIAEFDDHPTIQKKLIETATTSPQNFDRDVEVQRKEAEVAIRVAAIKTQLEADGVKVVEVSGYYEKNWYGNQGKGCDLTRLNIRPEEHADCPGHAAVIERAGAWALNDDTAFGIVYVCTDYAANGHHTRARERTPEDLEREAAMAREREEREARRQLVEANTRSRRTWIHGYLTTGRLRPTATHFDLMADALAAELYSEEPFDPAVVRELLDGEEYKTDTWQSQPNRDALLDVLEARTIPTLRIVVATAIARHEAHLGSATAVRYWGYLEQFGYTLTDTDKEHRQAAIAAHAQMLADDEDDEAGDDE